MDKIQQFLKNFEQNPAAIPAQEVANQYGAVTRQMPQPEYQQMAQEAFSQLTPQQRLELGRELIAGAQQQGVPFPDANRDGIDDRLQDPALLAGYTAQMQQAKPDMLSQLLGNTSNPMVKLALGGVAALGLAKLAGGGRGGHGGGLFGGGGGHHGGGHH